MADEFDDDVFQYEGSEFTQCISGFGRHVIEQVLGDIEDRDNDECTDAEIKDRITYNVGELVRWCRHFNGKSQSLAAEVAELRKQVTDADDRAREANRKFRQANETREGNFWCYQGDGEDHLESLTCSVSIRPQVLLGILKQLAEAKGRAVHSMSETPERWPAILLWKSGVVNAQEILDADEWRSWIESDASLGLNIGWLYPDDALAAPAATEIADKTCRMCGKWFKGASWCRCDGKHTGAGDSCDKHVEVRP
jgi:hypothetical protein